MKITAFAFITWLALTSVALSQSRGDILWLGERRAEHLAVWRANGFDDLSVPCPKATAACIINVLHARPQSRPAYLIAEASYSALVQELINEGVTKDHLSGIVLLGAQNSLMPLPPVKASNAPDILLLVPQTDPPGAVRAARKAANQLRDQGAALTFLFVGENAFAGPGLQRMTQDLILHFMGHSPFTENFSHMLKAYRIWETPPFSHEGFFAHEDILSTNPLPENLRALIALHYRNEPHQMKLWPLKRYRAFDLLAYRDKIAPGARFVTLRNKRGQVIFLNLDDYGPYGPEIVIGLDDESNLYRLTWFYRTKAMYSWKPGVQNISARFLGPILHFRQQLPEALGIALLLRSAITLEGITFTQENPLEALSAYPNSVQQVITQENKCLYCHQIEGLGGRYHHTEALTGKPQGGIALPLIDYPPEVMSAFLFDQENTARKIGMTPNPLDEEVAETFHHWVKDLTDAAAKKAAE